MCFSGKNEKKKKRVFCGRVYAGPEALPEHQETEEDGQRLPYPQNQVKKNKRKPMECVYAGPEYFDSKEV